MTSQQLAAYTAADVLAETEAGSNASPAEMFEASEYAEIRTLAESLGLLDEIMVEGVPMQVQSIYMSSDGKTPLVICWQSELWDVETVLQISDLTLRGYVNTRECRGSHVSKCLELHHALITNGYRNQSVSIAND